MEVTEQLWAQHLLSGAADNAFRRWLVQGRRNHADANAYQRQAGQDGVLDACRGQASGGVAGEAWQQVCSAPSVALLLLELPWSAFEPCWQ